MELRCDFAAAVPSLREGLGVLGSLLVGGLQVGDQARLIRHRITSGIHEQSLYVRLGWY